MHLLLLLVLLSISFVSAAQQRIQASYGPGTPVALVGSSILFDLNQERKYWGVPVLAYDDDLAAIAQYTCSQCAWTDVRPQAERQKMLCDLKGLPLGDPAVNSYQTVGDIRASSPAASNPSDTIWLNRNDWTCSTGSCVTAGLCDDYTQVIWNTTRYMGCGKCLCNVGTPIPQSGADWLYLVCHFSQTGNASGHPFGQDPTVRTEVCANNYTNLTPIQPTPCSVRNCTDPTSCPSPLSGATCNTATGHWQAGATKASDFKSNVYLGCNLDLTSFTATASDILRINQCGKISVSGTSTFTGNPKVHLDFQDVQGLSDQFYQPFFTASSQISGGVWDSAIAKGVWSTDISLCGEAITGTKTSYVALYDCADAFPSVVSPLPDGGTLVSGGQSSSNEASRTVVAGSGGDINDPDLQTLPKKSIIDTPVPPTPTSPTSPSSPQTPTPTSSPSGSSRLEISGCVIFLVVLGIWTVQQEM